jgi:hypothetical protein
MPRIYTVTDETGEIVGFYPTKKEAREMQAFFLQDTEEVSVQAVEYEPTREGVCRLLEVYGAKA